MDMKEDWVLLWLLHQYKQGAIFLLSQDNFRQFFLQVLCHHPNVQFLYCFVVNLLTPVKL